MTIYVRRGLDGAINLTSSAPYEDENGPTMEELSDDDQEVAAFLNPPHSTPPLTARQLRLGLAVNGLSLDQVETAINAMADDYYRAVAKIEWEWAAVFDRDHPVLQQVGAALGLTDEQIDAMWQQALAL